MAAEAGQFGAGVSARLRGVVAGLLSRGQGGHRGRGTATGRRAKRRNASAATGRCRPRVAPCEAALLTVAGRCLRRGVVPHRGGRAAGRHRRQVRSRDAPAARRGLHGAGQRRHRGHATALAGPTSSRTDCLPASLVIAACEHDCVGPQPAGPGRVATVLQALDSPPRWGRLYLALTLVDPDDAEDVAHLPSLVQAAWQAKGYHLRLKALDTAVRVGRRLDDQVRARLVDVLRLLRRVRQHQAQQPSWSRLSPPVTRLNR